MHKKRLLALLLSVVMVLGLLPATALAVEDDTSGTYTFIVPNDATLLVTDTEMYKGVTEFTPVDTAVNTPNGMTTYSFAATDAKTHCMFRVDGDDYITYAGSAYMTAGGSMTITKQMLKPSGQTQTLLDRDPTSHGGVNVCDLYMNINSEGYLQMPSVGSRYQFVGLRNWWTSNVDWGLGATYMWFQPNYHYTVLDENGNPSNDVVSIDKDGIITANGNGTAIVKVTYDAINIAYDDKDASKGNGTVGFYESNGFFGALWPENTGVFVVSVGEGDSGIDKGTTMEFPDRTRDVDADFDVIYFTGDSGSYNFTPATSGVTVSVANPKIGSYDDCNSMTFDGFKTLSANANGSYDVPLTDGRNILKLEKDGKANYQVLNAKKTGITVNGMPLEDAVVCAGEQLSIKFDTLFNPLNRNQYINSDIAPMYYNLSGLPGKHAGTGRGPYGYYFFVSSEEKHTLHSFLLETDDGSQWHNPIVKEDGELTIPEDFTGDTFDMTMGTFNTAGFGEIGGFRKNLGGFIDENGNKIETQSTDASIMEQVNDQVAAQDMAPGVFGYLSKLPDLSIPISTLDSISVTTMPNKTSYKLNETFNATGMVVTALYKNGKTKDVSADVTCSLDSSSVGDKTVTVSYTQGGVTKTTDITVNVNDISVTSVEITNPPTKTKYYPTEAFDPTGMVVVAHYSDGTEAELTQAEYTCTPSVFDNSAVDVPVTVTAGGQTATTPVTVDLVVKIELKAPLKSTELKAGNKFVPQNRSTRFLLIRGDGSSTARSFAGWSYAAPISRRLTVYDNKVYVGLGDSTPSVMGIAGLEPLSVDFTVVDQTGDMGTPITVYASCDDKGEWLIGKDGTTIKDVPLTVYDLDKDGKYTMMDAWVTLHHFYCPDDASGYDEYINTSAYGSSSTKRFWGGFQPNMIYTHNGEIVEDSDTELVEGDKITGHINAVKNDLYAWFDEASYTAKAGERSIFSVNGKTATTDNWAAAPNGATVSVYNSDGKKQDNLTTTVDKDGYFAIRFPSAGTYSVEVTGTCSYKDKNSSTVSGASVSPARCTIEVTDDSSEPKNSITAYMTYSSKGELVDTGNTLLYKVPVEVYDTNEDGKFTIGEAFQSLHKEYYSGGITGYQDDAASGMIGKFWGAGPDMSYTLNNAWVFSVNTEIKDKDSISAYHYADTQNYADLYTWFAKENENARVSVAKTFTVSGMNVMNSSSTFTSKAAPNGATVTVYDKDGNEVTDLATTTDAMGQFTIIFPSTGTYTVAVNGTCDYICVALDGSAGQNYKNAVVIPTRCTVNVTAASSGSSGGGGGGSSGGSTVSTDQTAANTVINQIKNIGTVTKDSASKIQAARAAYNKLTDAQKKLVTNYNTLTVAETALANLNNNPTSSTLPFKDVSNHWAKNAIQFAYDQGLFSGVSDTEFGPDIAMNRAMLVTVLYRMEDEPNVTMNDTFTDIASNQWYTKAVAWANANGIVSGYSDTVFGPNDVVTREQMASILYRYAKFKGMDVSSMNDLSAFTDKDSVSNWAQAAMQWANTNKLINGRTSTTLVPQGNATRAEVAQILMTYAQNAGK